MLLAYSETGQTIQPYKGGKAFCPGCKTLVLAKCGSTNQWHWAHESLDDCDGWKYEPKTQWHLHWQSYFHPDDTEVIIVKDGKFHIADIVGTNDVVIEIQNSPISADEIEKRELFYDKMLWVLNGRQFAGNLNIIGLPFYADSESLKTFIEYERDNNYRLKRIVLTVPLNDDGIIEKSLLRNPNLFRQDANDERIFYIDKSEILNSSGTMDSYNLPSDIRHAFVGHALHEAIMLKYPEVEESYRVDFQWLRMKRTFLKSSQPIFIDLGPSYLLYITKHNYTNHFEGLIITRKRFLDKYRKRKPNSFLQS